MADRSVDGDSARRLTLAALAPVTYEVAVQALGYEPNLIDDRDRATFFAVWAMLRVEYADAMMRELDQRDGETE